MVHAPAAECVSPAREEYSRVHGPPPAAPCSQPAAGLLRLPSPVCSLGPRGLPLQIHPAQVEDLGEHAEGTPPSTYCRDGFLL